MMYDFTSTFNIIKVLQDKFKASDNAKDSYAFIQAIKAEFQNCVDVIERDEEIFRKAMIQKELKDAEK